MKGISHIFFDLDHTLWDYDRCAKETLEELVLHFNLDVEVNYFVKTFYKINRQLWHQYNLGKIDREGIRQTRFKQILQKLNISYKEHLFLSEFFLDVCPTKPYLMPYADIALAYLLKKYRLHIITNGFDDVQHKKLNHSSLAKFFRYVVTSESAKARKPDADIFAFALNLTGAKKSACVMVGDNPLTDIEGSRNFGFKSVFYNPKSSRKSQSDFEIQSHLELLKLF